MIYESLINYIQDRSQSLLTSSDIALIRECFIYKKLRKRHFFLQEGDVCKHFGFIVKGSMRQYTIDQKGTERIIHLYIENWWASDRESFWKETPSIYNIDAWEETDLLLLPKENGYYERVNSIPAFTKMRLKLDDNNSIASQRRLRASMFDTAEKRYEELLKCYPAFVQRFPQHILASYLGITKETLSRIRNQPINK